MSRRKQKNFSCLSLSYDSATREFHVLKIQNKKKKRRKKGTANCNACNPADKIK